MMKNKDAYLVFRFESDDLLEIDTNCYSVVQFFTPDGTIGFPEIKKVKGDYNEDEPLTFKTKDQLTEFSYRFIEEHGHKSIFLLNAKDLNIGMESSHDTTSFRSIFEKFGLKIELQKEDGKGILGKLF